MSFLDHHFIIRDGKVSSLHQMMPNLIHWHVNMFGISMAKPGTTLRYSSDTNGLRDKTDRIIIKSFKQTINLIKE
jgi:hypothetical protein